MRFPSLLTIASTIALSFTLAACGDDPSIVASWREMPNALDEDPRPVEERERWTFKEDGTVALTDDDQTLNGTYTLDGDRLKMTVVEEGDSESIEATVVVTDDRFLFAALTPSGDVDGAVGSWTGDVVIGTERIALTLNLRADGTGDYIRTEAGEQPESFTGSWREQGDSLEFSFSPEPDFTINFQLFRVGEEGLGGPLFEKAPDQAARIAVAGRAPSSSASIASPLSWSALRPAAYFISPTSE